MRSIGGVADTCEKEQEGPWRRGGVGDADVKGAG